MPTVVKITSRARFFDRFLGVAPYVSAYLITFIGLIMLIGGVAHYQLHLAAQPLMDDDQQTSTFWTRPLDNSSCRELTRFKSAASWLIARMLRPSTRRFIKKVQIST